MTFFSSFWTYNCVGAVSARVQLFLGCSIITVHFISRPAHRREIIICTMCVYVRACVSVSQFSLKLLQLHIFGKLLVPMNFYARYFWGFGELWPTFE